MFRDFLLIRNHFYLHPIVFAVTFFPHHRTTLRSRFLGGWRLIMIEERTGIITFQGNPLTLIGKRRFRGRSGPGILCARQ